MSAIPVGPRPPAWTRSSFLLPVWDPSVCIDCGRCCAACPHDALAMKVFIADALDGAPPTFQSKEFRSEERAGRRLNIQLAPDNCTGCGICVDVCPTPIDVRAGHKAITMLPDGDHRDWLRQNFSFSQTIPHIGGDPSLHDSVMGTKALAPGYGSLGAAPIAVRLRTSSCWTSSSTTAS